MTAHTEQIKVDPAAHLTSPLVRVKLGTAFFLHYPEKIEEPTGKYDSNNVQIMRTLFNFGQDTGRGGAGYVLDWTQPLEREWCKGQEHKLENVPEEEMADAKPSPLAHPQALIAIEQRRLIPVTKDLAAKQAEADAARRAAATATPPKATRQRRGYTEIEG